jgi:hypothetical protein
MQSVGGEIGKLHLEITERLARFIKHFGGDAGAVGGAIFDIIARTPKAAVGIDVIELSFGGGDKLHDFIAGIDALIAHIVADKGGHVANIADDLLRLTEYVLIDSLQNIAGDLFLILTGNYKCIVDMSRFRNVIFNNFSSQ